MIRWRYRHETAGYSITGAHNLRESPLRTALCALSVAVGSGALLLILSIGLYGRKQVDVGLQTLGVSGLSVYTESGHAGTILSAALADEIEQDVDGIRALMPIKAQSGTVRVGHTTEHAVLLGADERLGEVMQMEMLAGTLPNAWQCANAEPVAWSAMIWHRRCTDGQISPDGRFG